MVDKPTVLATDLDGTLIPLDNDPIQQRDLQCLKKHFQSQADTLVFVTGRHLESALQAIDEHLLPKPDWIICDVGTSIYHYPNDGSVVLSREYSELLSELTAQVSLPAVRERLANHTELRLQEPEKQGAFKLSFYVTPSRVRSLAQQLTKELCNEPFEVISSLDPGGEQGLIDVLPRNVSKAFALQWWARATNRCNYEIVYSGDSGNDLAPLTAGFLAVVVGNAEPSLIAQVRSAPIAAGGERRLYIAQASATSGVLEGCRHYGLLNDT